jgi:hypothetical protein
MNCRYFFALRLRPQSPSVVSKFGIGRSFDSRDTNVSMIDFVALSFAMPIPAASRLMIAARLLSSSWPS